MKKNNKGFSLVEVIAVIAILGILSGITIMAVTRLTTSSKKKTYKNFEDNLKKASNNYLIGHNELAEEENLKLDAQTLIDEGFLEAMTDPVNKKGNCNKDSYVIITGKRENATDYNISYSYNVCLICPSYTSPKCDSIKNPEGEGGDKQCPGINANIVYNHSSLTNQDVVAKLTISSPKVTILNNSGSDSYTFKENGKFKFQYETENNCKGTITAEVNWIDKIIPKAIVEYSNIEKTNEPVIAKLTEETEPITIINNDGKNTYTFQENGTFEFVYQDKAGNIGRTLAKVDWIDKSSTGEDSKQPTDPDPTPDPNNPDQNPDSNNPSNSPDDNQNITESTPNNSGSSSDDSNKTGSNGSTDSNEQDTQKKETTDKQKNQKKKKSYLPLIFEIITIIILVFIFLFLKRKNQERNNYID